MAVRFHKRFQKRYAKLPRRIQHAFDERLEIFLQNPRNPLLDNHELNPPWEGCASINVTGDIRAIYQPRGKDILFLKIGSHAELYGS